MRSWPRPRCSCAGPKTQPGRLSFFFSVGPGNPVQGLCIEMCSYSSLNFFCFSTIPYNLVNTLLSKRLWKNVMHAMLSSKTKEAYFPMRNKLRCSLGRGAGFGSCEKIISTQHPRLFGTSTEGCHRRWVREHMCRGLEALGYT